MDEKLKEKVEKKLKEGWIKSTMFIEALAITSESVESALKKHIEAMEKEDNTIIYKKSFKDIKKIEKPFKNIKEAYSYIVELELLTASYEQLIYIIVTYAPSSVEILEPENISMTMAEAQGILNSIADIIHRFAAIGAGGVVIRT